jgi:hypothetical protein
MTDVRSSGGSDVGVSSGKERDEGGRWVLLVGGGGVVMSGDRVAVLGGVVVVWCRLRNRRTEGHKGHLSRTTTTITFTLATTVRRAHAGQASKSSDTQQAPQIRNVRRQSRGAGQVRSGETARECLHTARHHHRHCICVDQAEGWKRWGWLGGGIRARQGPCS